MKAVSRQWSVLSKNVFCFALSALLFALSLSAQAQQPTKIFWIGYLTGSGSSPNPAFVQGMRDLGYVEGKNVAFVYRTAEGTSGRYDDLAAELVH
jgi:putative tryptophan/tyrosine transport system substrate-binding protein